MEYARITVHESLPSGYTHSFAMIGKGEIKRKNHEFVHSKPKFHSKTQVGNNEKDV